MHVVRERERDRERERKRDSEEFSDNQQVTEKSASSTPGRITLPLGTRGPTDGREYFRGAQTCLTRTQSSTSASPLLHFRPGPAQAAYTAQHAHAACTNSSTNSRMLNLYFSISTLYFSARISRTCMMTSIREYQVTLSYFLSHWPFAPRKCLPLSPCLSLHIALCHALMRPNPKKCAGACTACTPGSWTVEDTTHSTKWLLCSTCAGMCWDAINGACANMRHYSP